MGFNIYAVVLCLVLMSATPTGAENGFKNMMIVWNVGQGQWATLKDATGCHHFDMGGEHGPFKAVEKLCGREQNYIYLSHWDLDHISFVEKSARFLPKRCLVLGPLGTSTWRKSRAVQDLPKCSDDSRFQWQELTDFARETSKNLTSNETCHVILADHRFLIPGDSDIRQEKIWDQQPGIANTKWLLLGHHGSRTSTSEGLLERIPFLKTAVSSARFKRYGHPHMEVVTLLRHHHIPLLRTEDWGNIWFEFRP